MTETLDPFRALLAAKLADALRAPAASAITRRPEPEAPVRLTGPQRAMWLRWQFEPDDPAYNVPFVLRLRGPLDRDALLRSVQLVLERHEILRSTVVPGPDGEPACVTQPVSAVPVSCTDLRAGELDAALQTEARRPFDLEADVPARVLLGRLGTTDHLLAWTFHHIAVDAHSRATIFEELSGCYNALTQGLPLPTAPAVQHGDYAASEHAAVTVPPEEPAWWTDRLTGAPAVCELPSAGRRTVPPWPAEALEFSISQEIVTKVKALATESGCTTFMVFLAALKILLSRLSGTTDVVVGTPEAGRPREELRKMVGCFVGTLPIRTDLGGDLSGLAALDRVRESALDSFAHASVPLDRIVKALNPPRTPDTPPVVQVMLNLYDAPDRDARFGGLTAEPVEVPPATAKLDLVWHLVDHGNEELQGSLVYRADLFDRTSARQLAGWFRAVLEQFLADPGAPLRSIRLAPESVLRGPALPPGEPFLVHHGFERRARQHPDAPAVVADDGVLTYRQLDERAESVAALLRAAGVVPGRPVGLLLDRRTTLIAAILGVLKAGAFYVPMDPAFPAERIAKMTHTAEVGVILSDRVRTDLPARVLAVGSAASAELPPRAEVAPADLAYAIFTSGSTGEPKAVGVRHGNLAHYLRAVHALIGEHIPDAPSFALVSTIAADLGLTNVFGALVTGGTLHLPSRETTIDPAAYARYLAANPVDVIKMVPSHLELLAGHGDLAGVLPRRLLILAGEACSWDLVDRIRAARPDLALQVHYGPTETTVSVLGGAVSDIPADRRGAVVPLGRPLADIRCFVVDAAGHLVPEGVAGELWIGGPTVAAGYLGRDDRTAERFVPGPVDRTATCYRTGDRVRLRGDGRLEFLGRLDDQVKIRGFRVEPGEIAARLRELPGVSEAIVLAVGPAGAARRLVGWVTGTGVEPASIRARLRDGLPDYLVPSDIVVLTEMPLNPNGKIDRAALPIPADRPATGDGSVTPAEAKVAAAWTKVLGTHDLGRDDDFFARGGDSFLALRVTREIGGPLALADFLARPTIRAQAAFLDQAPPPTHRILRRLGESSADVTTAVVCIPYAGGTPAAYLSLAAALSPAAAVWAAALPGHDPGHPGEPLLDMATLVARLADEVAETCPGPVVLYGHSAGAATAAALALELERRGHPVGTLIAAAQLPVPAADHDLPDEDYRRALLAAGGLSEQLDLEVQRFLVRAARHDAREARSWFSRAAPADKLTAQLVCAVGSDDAGTAGYETEHRHWGRIAQQVSLVVVPGAGHYFAQQNPAELTALISESVRPC